MASIKPVLRIDKVKKNGSAPLYLRVTKERKTSYKVLGLDLDPKDWDSVGLRVKKSHPNSARANNLIAQRISALNDRLLTLEAQQHPYRADRVFDALGPAKSKGLIEFSNQVLVRMEAINSVGMVDRVKSVISKVRVYCNGKDVPLIEVSVGWLKDYESYLRLKLGNSTNTIGANMKVIRKILNDAEREELIPVGRNPFDRYQIKSETTEVEYLTEDELADFMKVELTEGTKLQRHRDLYVFACYAGGIRIGDLITLQWKNFDGERISLVTSKTNEPISIKLGNAPLGILEKQTKNRNPEGFIFGLLEEGFDLKNDRALNLALSRVTALVNKNLKVVAKKAGIEKNIHFHTSRHTWATRALRKGMRIEHVSKLLTHKSIRTTQIYAKIVNSDLDEAMSVFND